MISWLTRSYSSRVRGIKLGSTGNNIAFKNLPCKRPTTIAKGATVIIPFISVFCVFCLFFVTFAKDSYPTRSRSLDELVFDYAILELRWQHCTSLWDSKAYPFCYSFSQPTPQDSMHASACTRLLRMDSELARLWFIVDCVSTMLGRVTIDMMIGWYKKYPRQ
jgi:hypothetical protein